MQRLIIGAPFGNYIGMPHATSTLGTFTLERRAGPLKRLWRVVKTVRYYHGIGAFKNKLGLPNPGIASLFPSFKPEYLQRYQGTIISVSARQTRDWIELFESLTVLSHAGVTLSGIELNVSCPNCPGEADASNYAEVFREGAERFGTKLIVKLPPIGYEEIAKHALGLGVTGFHCCNTIPTPGGGLSGKPLKPIALAAVRRVLDLCDRQRVKSPVIIGGGGVTSLSDAQEYRAAGATNVAVASVLFWPWKWPTIRAVARNLQNP